MKEETKLKQCNYWDLFGMKNAHLKPRESARLTHPSAMCRKCIKCLNSIAQGEAAEKRFNLEW
tara:strand:- start:385 stop:573 length:189 start_codon:yes stop_codon:yes gene_type:complete